MKIYFVAKKTMRPIKSAPSYFPEPHISSDGTHLIGRMHVHLDAIDICMDLASCLGAI